MPVLDVVEARQRLEHLTGPGQMAVPQVFGIPDSLSFWQTLASYIVFQNMMTARPWMVNAPNQEHRLLAGVAGIPLTTDDPTQVLAYGSVEPGELPYPAALAAASSVVLRRIRRKQTVEEMVMGAPMEMMPSLGLWLAGMPEQKSGIVICPYTFLRELELPIAAWQPIITMLRTFGEPVHLLSAPGQRFDSAKFCENDTLANYSLVRRLSVLRTATLVVGVPNEWTWLAAAWDKKMVYFYPETEPVREWFWASSEKTGRCIFDPARVEIPALMAGLRILLNTELR